MIATFGPEVYSAVFELIGAAFVGLTVFDKLHDYFQNELFNNE